MKKSTKLVWILLLITAISSCNKKKVGEVTIEAITNSSEILIDNFPKPAVGVEGNDVISYPSDFSFLKIDEAIYDYLGSKDYKTDNVAIKVRNLTQDRYGKILMGDWVMLGSLNAEEAKKFTDFATWNRNYGLFKLLQKPTSFANKEEAVTPQNTGVNEQSLEESPEDKQERLSVFSPFKGVNTTIYNQSEDNLKRLNWRQLDDVFFYEHIEFYPKVRDPESYEGIVIGYKERAEAHLDILTVQDVQHGKIDIHFNSLESGKSILKPKGSILKVGDKIEGWGAKVVEVDKTYWFLNQVILKEN